MLLENWIPFKTQKYMEYNHWKNPNATIYSKFIPLFTSFEQPETPTSEYNEPYVTGNNLNTAMFLKLKHR